YRVLPRELLKAFVPYFSHEILGSTMCLSCTQPEKFPGSSRTDLSIELRERSIGRATCSRGLQWGGSAVTNLSYSSISLLISRTPSCVRYETLAHLAVDSLILSSSGRSCSSS